MIPLKLTVKNFMCYRDEVPTLDFEGIHVACLCGDNGHGKTALLDSITWVLWGQARARTQEELVHQGSQDMAVVLEFMAREQRYRVSRRYSRSGRSRGVTILELQVSSGNGFQAITGNSIRETEARIRDILHLDYETFVNTAFLLQGRADMFTRSTPARRKEVLAEVLDLSYYTKLEERAKERSRNSQDGILAAENVIALHQQNISRRPEYEERVALVKATLQGLGAGLDSRRRQVASVEDRLNTLKGRGLELESLDQRLLERQGETAELARRVRVHEGSVGGYQVVVARETEIREHFARLEDVRTELDRLGQAAFAASGIEQERARLREAVAVQHERLSSKADQLRDRISRDLEPKVRRIPGIEEELRLLALGEDKLAELTETIQERRRESEETDGTIRYLRQANEDLRTGMEDTRKKFDILNQDGGECPVCKQPLGSEGKEHLRLEYEAEGRARRASYDENVEEERTLGARYKELAGLIVRLEAERDTRQRGAQSAAATLERDLEDARTAQGELQPALADLRQIESDIVEQRFARERDRLSELEDELGALAYEPDAHRTSQQQARELEPYDELNRRLLEALDALPGELKTLDDVQQTLARRREEAASDETRRVDLAREMETLPGLELEMAGTRKALNELEIQERDARAEEKYLADQLVRLSEFEQEVRLQEKERRGLVERKSIYDVLAVAFGKNGIQALIIETAIPQLQDDANELLGRLTDNRMFLKLQLQEGRRERRMGLPSEELEIKISDEVGTRSYETFSGGETFRINFALRIALSKLLARRSGAPLPILFIDEGFGTQDANGQERLKEAIQSIQSDFQKIIVITHVEQVKESFPVRIEVIKTPDGSTFVVV